MSINKFNKSGIESINMIFYNYDVLFMMSCAKNSHRHTLNLLPSLENFHFL